jgi:hypothetical protein
MKHCLDSLLRLRWMALSALLPTRPCNHLALELAAQFRRVVAALHVIILCLMVVQELYNIPGKSCDRKVNELVKRIRALRVHLLLLKHLKGKMPALLFKESTQAKILEEMPQHFIAVRPCSDDMLACHACLPCLLRSRRYTPLLPLSVHTPHHAVLLGADATIWSQRDGHTSQKKLCNPLSKNHSEQSGTLADGTLAARQKWDRK